MKMGRLGEAENTPTSIRLRCIVPYFSLSTNSRAVIQIDNYSSEHQILAGRKSFHLNPRLTLYLKR
ncbi:hypothetical protein SLEP1_g53475 [Rubroshorea leprosula]|uniref:Uncharacterized protein n=1 Tax=Rubroshorea leprosula TaxID=152421 RepID=A0AAV5M9U4_9ROSI|nr:hypothetical protein SLEP1_g53471 [Rubroshorea leprosula]GKV46493.1 hypothetical protein SLEP1_g53475 [Rubroshorea leprosula]